MRLSECECVPACRIGSDGDELRPEDWLQTYEEPSSDKAQACGLADCRHWEAHISQPARSAGSVTADDHTAGSLRVSRTRLLAGVPSKLDSMTHAFLGPPCHAPQGEQKLQLASHTMSQRPRQIAQPVASCKAHHARDVRVSRRKGSLHDVQVYSLVLRQGGLRAQAKIYAHLPAIFSCMPSA